MSFRIKGELPKPNKFEAAKALVHKKNCVHHSRERDVYKGRSRKPKNKSMEGEE